MKRLLIISTLATALGTGTISSQDPFNNIKKVFNRRPRIGIIRTPEKQLIHFDYDCNKELSIGLYQAFAKPSERDIWMSYTDFMFTKCRKTMPTEKILINNIRSTEDAMTRVLENAAEEEEKIRPEYGDTPPKKYAIDRPLMRAISTCRCLGAAHETLHTWLHLYKQDTARQRENLFAYFSA